VLEDLTAGLTLLLDRPFHVGDCISVGGGPSGSVVHVGIKSTELQCANGDRLVVCNKDVANAKINKFLPTADR
jgi:small-conductance mechanosensitive channel